MSGILRLRLTSVVYMLAVATAGLVPLSVRLDTSATGSVELSLGRLMHSGAYLVMVILVFGAWRGRQRTGRALCVAAIHGVLLEAMQGVVSWRCFEWGDLFYNVIGVVAAWAILVLGRRLGLSIPGIDFLT